MTFLTVDDIFELYQKPAALHIKRNGNPPGPNHAANPKGLTYN